MPDANASRSAPLTYLAQAMLVPVNRIAAAVALAAGLVVVLGAQVPLEGEVWLDLRDLPRGPTGPQLTLQGFDLPCETACTTAGPRARLVFNRPLPAAFTLVIEGREVAPARDQPGSAVEVGIGERRGAIPFGDARAPHTLPLANPRGARVIELSSSPGQRIALTGVGVRPAGGP
jgi:hypothetical protein